MAVLVTGATGLVGSSLVRRLCADGESVRILRREESKLDLLGDAAEHVTHFIGDVSDSVSVRNAMHDVDRVYHVAARIESRGKKAQNEMYAANVTGTSNVVNAALENGVRRLVHTSSMAAFGRSAQSAVIHENTEWTESVHNSFYANSKHLAELEIHRGIAEGLDAVIVNPALIFGVGRSDENTRQIIDAVRYRKLPAIPTGGTNVVDVEDVVEGHVQAMEIGRTGERYFLGSENISWRDVIVTIAKTFDVKPPRRTMQPSLAVAFAYLMEAASILPGIDPLITLETARSTARFYRYDNSKAKNELRISFRPFESTVLRVANAIG